MKFSEATEKQRQSWRDTFCTPDACPHGDEWQERCLGEETCFELHQEQYPEEFEEAMAPENAEGAPPVEVHSMMDRVDFLVRQLQELTSKELCYRVLEWMSSISAVERDAIVADYIAQEAEAPRPSFYQTVPEELLSSAGVIIFP